MILNLTQHNATPEQVNAGVTEPTNKSAVQKLLTFESLPTIEDIRNRARALSDIAASAGATGAMIGGAGWLTSSLEDSLRSAGIKPMHSFSRREAGEERLPDGSVRKTQVFRHIGFVEV